MVAEETLEKQRNAQQILITEYISKDGYLWAMILKAMEEYAKTHAESYAKAKLEAEMPSSDCMIGKADT